MASNITLLRYDAGVTTVAPVPLDGREPIGKDHDGSRRP